MGVWSELGEINAFIKTLMGQVATDDPREMIRQVNAGELALKAVPFLTPVVTASVNGAEQFCAKDHLARANVGWTDNNFDQLFLNKVEKNVLPASIAVHQLKRSSTDKLIMAELGAAAEIQLAYLFELIKAQSQGQEGVLLVNGYANIAYIRGTDGNLWAVDAGWGAAGGWGVSANSFVDPGGGGAGLRVLSRDSE